MSLIKATDAAPLIKDAIVLDLGDLGRQATRLKEAALTKAQQIVRDAQSEARRLTQQSHGLGLEQGRSEGFAKGLEEGRAQGRAEALKQASEQLRRLQENWTRAAAEWDRQRQDMDRQAREAVLALAVRMGEKLTHRLVEIDPTVVVDQVAMALGHVLRPLDVTVRIHPEDRPVMEEALPQLLAEFAQLKHVRLMDDPAVGRGGCVLTYGQGRVDATIDTQLRRVVELLIPDDVQVRETPSVRPEGGPASADDRPIPGGADTGGRG